MKTDSRTRMNLNVQQWIFTALLLCVLGMLGWLSQQRHWQADVTANARNSLSSSSIELLATLDSEVSIKLYARDDDPVLIAAIQEIMDRYMREKPDFSYRIVNPDIDFATAEADEISRYGEIVVSYAGRTESIDNLSEQAISSALLRMSREPTDDIVFLTGHGERDIDAADNRGYNKLADQLRNLGFSVMSHHLLEGELPATTSVLVIAGMNRDISAGELTHIEDYVDAGGNLLWLVDPGILHGLDNMAIRLGVRFHDGMVVDNNIELRRTLQIQHPAIIPVLEYYPHPISKGISFNSLFPLARGVEPDVSGDSEEWTHAVLWRSFERSWTETGSLSEEIVFDSASGDIAGPIPLAVAIDRVLTDGSQDKASQRIVVAGDTDFLANAYIGVGANLNLASNLFAWLAGDDDLIAVDIKSANDLQLQLTDTQVALIGFGFLIVLPLSLMVAGGLIWFSRKRR